MREVPRVSGRSCATWPLRERNFSGFAPLVRWFLRTPVCQWLSLRMMVLRKPLVQANRGLRATWTRHGLFPTAFEVAASAMRPFDEGKKTSPTGARQVTIHCVALRNRSTPKYYSKSFAVLQGTTSLFRSLAHDRRKMIISEPPWLLLIIAVGPQWSKTAASQATLASPSSLG